jgi:hypothetical protein
MEDTRPKAILEAMELTRKDMDLEKDLDTLDYNYKNARSSILNAMAKIQMRLGELTRTEGISPQRSQVEIQRWPKKL